MSDTKPAISIAEWEEKNPLFVRHPWYRHMDHHSRWRRYRAILEAFESEEAKKSYLPKGVMELDGSYDARISFSNFFGISEDAIDQVSSSVFGDSIQIDAPGLEGFLADCDGAGMSFQEFIEPVAREALGMGIAFVVVDGPDEDPVPSRKDEFITGRNRAYVSRCRAEEVINWSEDRRGRLEWANVRRVVSVQSEAEQDRREFLELTNYTTTSIRRWHVAIEKDGMTILEDAVPVEQELKNPTHDLKVVPVFPVYGIKLGTFMGDSFIKGSSRADIAGFNNQSWWQMALFRHATPLLAIKSSEKSTNILTTGNVVRLDVNEELFYVDLPDGAFQARQDANKFFEREGIRKTGMNPSAIADSAQSSRGESGIAQRVRFTQTQKKIIDRHARNVQNSIIRILDAAELYVTEKKTPTKKSVAIHAAIDLDESVQSLRDARDAQYINSPTFVREMQKKAARMMLSKASQETIAAINAEIDSAQVSSADSGA